MNFDVLLEVELVPAKYEIAMLPGFDIRIAPRANIFRHPQQTVHGILATATHAELDRLYRGHARGALGEIYLPEAVVAIDGKGQLRPALTYIAPAMDARPADAGYIERIVRPAKAYGFPTDYIEKLESFKP